MVPKRFHGHLRQFLCFRAVLFRMVPKLRTTNNDSKTRFRAVLFRMVPKQAQAQLQQLQGFRAVLFRMVPKHLLAIHAA